MLRKQGAGSEATTDLLKAYVPRFLLDWARRSPEARHRAVEGTLAFVDISGFTKMCERLARRGKVGAEEVNDVLDDCFTQLLAIAYEDGGGVLKWGGDAVLLLFTGPDHATRACRAGHRMRARLRKIGSRLQTSAGFVSLRMSVGIHSGTFHLFLVGDVHRELVITGPGATRTVHMEQTASAGEIAISPETAERIGRHHEGSAKGDAILLKGEPTDVAPRPSRAAVDATGLDLAQCIPLRVRDYLLQGGGEAEHRHVAVGFLEFRGTDEIIRKDGPERAWEALDGLIRCVQRAAREHDVTFFETDVSSDGGKVMLVAGAPSSSGNEEEQMLRASRAIVESDSGLEVRIGVNSGHVFSGIFGPPYRRTYSIKGDAVNLAARVMGKAAPGQVLATASAVDRSRTLFQLEPLEPFMVKGKKQPVQALSVGPVTGVKAPAGWLHLPLVGREQEMNVLMEGVRSALGGRGSLVEIVGEPGIGKSRLVQELRAQAGDLEATAVACDPYESSTPYHPFRDLLRKVLGIPLETEPQPAGTRLEAEVRAAAPELLPWLPLLATVISAEVGATPEVDDLEPQFRKPRLEHAIGDVLTAIVRRPALIILEDVHWMDEPSVDLLSHLASIVAELPWLLCVTRRDQEAGFTGDQSPEIISVRPAPLTREDATRLGSTASEDTVLSPRDIDELAQRSGGNPLFLQELISAAGTSRSVETLPDSVEGLLSVQIDRLPVADRTLLRYASVLGATFERSLLNAVVALDRRFDDDGIWTRLADFVSVDSAGTFRFRHALIRDVAYEGLPYRRRREIHARVGETLELWAGDHAAEQSELLSLHFYEAGRYQEAWLYSRWAGERAQAKYANTEAAGFFRRAVQAARAAGVPLVDLVDVYRSLGDVCDRGGLYEHAARAYNAARRLVAGDPVKEAELLLKEGVIRERSGRYADAMKWYTRGLRTLEGGSDGPGAAAARAQLSVWYAAARRQQGRLKDAIRWCERAIAEAERGGDREALAHAYRLLAWTFADLGSPESTRYGALALSSYEELGDRIGLGHTLNDLGIYAYFEGRWSDAVALYERSRVIWKTIGDEVNAALGTNNIGEIRSDQGRLDEADELFREALAIWRAAPLRLGVAFAKANLGRLAGRRGRHDEAVSLLETALREFREIGAEGQALETEARIADSFLGRGDSEAALELATRTLRRTETMRGLPALRAMLHRTRGYALFHSDLEAAERALEEGLAVARSAHADYEVALTLEARARLAELAHDPSAESIADEAFELLDRLGVEKTPDVPFVTAPQVMAAENEIRAPLA